MSRRRRLPPGLYGLDELTLGDRIETGTLQVEAARIDAFAELTGDRFEIHMTDAAAARHGFTGRVAHGLLVLSLVDGLKNGAPARIKARASLGWDWRFDAPVIAGDTIRAELEVAETRATRHPDRGIVRLDFEVRNHRGELVQSGCNRLMVYA